MMMDPEIMDPRRREFWELKRMEIMCRRKMNLQNVMMRTGGAFREGDAIGGGGGGCARGAGGGGAGCAGGAKGGDGDGGVQAAHIKDDGVLNNNAHVDL